MRGQPWIVAEQRPIPGLDGEFLLIQAIFQVVAMRDAVTIGNDERRTGIRFRFQKSLQRLAIVGSHGNARHINGSIRHGQHPEVFLCALFATRREFGDRSTRRRFRHLSPRVRINLGIEHQDVNIAPRRKNVIQTAIADVISPTIAAHQPHALIRERIRYRP